MSVLTLCATRSLGIHVVELDAAEQALRSSWEADYQIEGDDAEGVRAELDDAGRVSRKQLALVYSLQLAEAYVICFPRASARGVLTASHTVSSLRRCSLSCTCCSATANCAAA